MISVEQFHRIDTPVEFEAVYSALLAMVAGAPDDVTLQSVRSDPRYLALVDLIADYGSRVVRTQAGRRCA